MERACFALTGVPSKQLQPIPGPTISVEQIYRFCRLSAYHSCIFQLFHVLASHGIWLHRQNAMYCAIVTAWPAHHAQSNLYPGFQGVVGLRTVVLCQECFLCMDEGYASLSTCVCMPLVSCRCIDSKTQCALMLGHVHNNKSFQQRIAQATPS